MDAFLFLYSREMPAVIADNIRSSFILRLSIEFQQTHSDLQNKYAQNFCSGKTKVRYETSPYRTTIV